MCIGKSEGSLRKRHLTKVTLCYVVLYCNIGTGTSTAGQAVAGSVLARPFPKGTVLFGASNVPFGSAPKPIMCPLAPPTYF